MLLKINNWEKYNPRKDYKRPWWFSFNNNFFFDSDFYSFNDAERLFWIYLLCEASRYNKDGLVKLNHDHAQKVLNQTKKQVESGLDKILKISIVSEHLYGICTESVRNLYATEHNITEHNRTNTTDFAPRKAARDSFDFEIAYKEYPRKEGKAKGLLKCKAQVKTQEDFDLLLKAIRNYSNHLKRENTEKRFIKHFSTFLEAGQWRDWLEAETGKVAAPVARAGPDKVLEELKRMDENKIPKDAQVNNAKDILATLKKGFTVDGLKN